MSTILFVIIYAILGIIIGLMAVLFGFSGGTIIVPSLSFVYPKLFPYIDHDTLFHMSLGTSIACGFFNMLSTTWTYSKLKRINYSIFFILAPGLLVGSYIGPIISTMLSKFWLKKTFAIFLFGTTYILFNKKYLPKIALNFANHKQLIIYSLIGIFIGSLSSLVGLGGGALIMPLLLFINIRSTNAVGTTAICCLIITCVATISYIINGLNLHQLPSYSIGYVYLPAVTTISAASFVTIKTISTFDFQLRPKTVKYGVISLLMTIAFAMLFS